MKKKGMLVTTIVLGIVLIAALVTATFAWFSATVDSAILPLSVEVKSNTAVLFGLHKNGYNGAETQEQNYVSGAVHFTKKSDGKADGTWSGTAYLGDLDLGQVFTSKLNFSKAVGTADLKGMDVSSFDEAPDKKFDTSHSIIKAYGTSDSAITKGTVEYAVENTDYIHLPLGIKLIDGTKTKLSCKITLKLNNDDPKVGLAAGLHVVYQKNTEGSGNFEFIDDGNDADTLRHTAGYDERSGKSVEIPLVAETDTIQNLDLYIILAGYDKDTTTAAATRGLDATFTIEFVTE